MALEKTTDISDNGSGGVTYNHDSYWFRVCTTG